MLAIHKTVNKGRFRVRNWGFLSTYCDFTGPISASRVSSSKCSVAAAARRGEMSRSHGGGSELLALARRFNCFYLQGIHEGVCTPFVVEGHQVGLVRPDILCHLQRFPEVFHVRGRVVELNPAFRDYKERSSRVAAVLQQLRKENALCTLRGWRDECFAVSVPFHEDLLEMDRCAMCLFGIRNYGVSVTGYIQHPTRGLCVWLQQRSSTKQTWPGKWDCFVSGGLAVGFGVLETTVKEAAEEASVDSELAKTMVPAGCVSFYFECERGLFPNTEYVYDLELPLQFMPRNTDGEVQNFELLTADSFYFECERGLFPNTEYVYDLELPLQFMPRNTDGEVQNFELLTADECIQRALTADFKTTSAPVLIDFLIRKGHITPENEPNYRMLVELLHVPLQTLYQRRGGELNGRCD